MREEKQLEASLESLLARVAHLKGSLQSFILKLENEHDRLTWPSVLDNFALLSGQLNTINKVLKNEKTPSYRSQVIIPLLLSPDRDEELVKLTEQRVPVFSHEIVPDHLRTKPDPEVEEQEKHLSAEAARIGPEVAQVNKHTNHLAFSNNNDAENSALITAINCFLNITIVNRYFFTPVHYCFCCIFEINAALVSRRDFFKNKTYYWPQISNGSVFS
uniref:Mediator of RNA polymerase II transcription subunit 8 n=1 Tax=Sinocyclocheilus rhinocerous TaxID=307959 RepID=A0A673JGV1_9TELE